MKKTVCTILVAIPFLGFAQKDPKNAVKINFSPTMSMVKNLGINYERKLSNSFSANVRLNYATRNIIPFNNFADKKLGSVLSAAGVESDFLSTRFNSFGASLQFKYFVKNKALQGFYLTPYFGYQTGGLRPLTFNFPDPDDVSVKHEGQVSADFSFLGAGLGIGNQWIHKGFTLDIMWVGLGLGGNTFKLRGQDTSGDINYEYANEKVVNFLADEGSKIDDYGLTLSSNYSRNHIEIVGKHVFPYMKFLNISVGYAF